MKTLLATLIVYNAFRLLVNGIAYPSLTDNYEKMKCNAQAVLSVIWLTWAGILLSNMP